MLKTTRTQRSRTSTNRSTTRVISHRIGSKAAAAHIYVRQHRAAEPSEVIGALKRKYKLTQGTARNWYQSFKKNPMDWVPSAH